MRFITFLMSGMTTVLVAVWWWTTPPSLPSAEAVRAAYQPSDAWLYDRQGVLLAQVRKEYGGRRLAWTPLPEVAPVLLEVLLAAEDHRFQTHHGVDGLALMGSLRDRLLKGTRRGASTLTMQLVAQMDEVLQQAQGRRGWRLKWRQMRLAWQLERGWTKAQILEAYLNRVSFRGEWQGIATASRALFSKAPSQLNRSESAVLVSLLRAPSATPPQVAVRACRLLPEAECRTVQSIVAEALAPGRQPVFDKALAPHLAHRLLQRGGESVRSTVDAGVQSAVIAALRDQLSVLNVGEARDAAAVVVDNASGDVLAYVGSAGPQTRAEQVDGVQALRQAGSTLKPFLYGMALERELLTPVSLLDDSAVHLETGAGLYIPQNYDHEFRGWVSVRSALAGSLNVPAVRTLLLVGLEPLRDRLREFGYRNGLTEAGEFYGFALALGAPEVTLLEQANAFRTLANGGVWKPLRLRLDEAPVEPERRVLSPAAAFMVGDILSDNSARAVSFGLGSPLVTPFWSAVKTGTSKNMRDNWCVGYTTRHTVAVWVGNFEGEPMRNVSGVTGAAPAWLEIMRAISAESPPPAPGAPAELVRSAVRFMPAVESPREDWFLKGSELREVRVAMPSLTRPRIVSPQNGLIAALDPDIPAERQHLLFEAHAVAGTRWQLDGRDAGSAQARRLWVPVPGRHHLMLKDGAGKTLDEVRFEVRGVVTQ